MNILITGGNGYIAKSLYQALKEDYSVTKVARSDFDLTDCVATTKYFEDKYFDVVIHTAVSGGSRLKDETWGTMDTNLVMYYNLLQNRKSFEKLIHFGSGAEQHAGHTPYGLSKKVIANSILDQPGFYNLRIFAVFDENELGTRFIKANIERYLNKEPLEIHQNKFMDFFYMKDLVKLVEFYITSDNPPKSVDCSYDTLTDLQALASYINSLEDYRVNILIKEQGFGQDYFGEHVDLGLCYYGLRKGVSEVYNKLKNEKNKLFN